MIFSLFAWIIWSIALLYVPFSQPTVTPCSLQLESYITRDSHVAPLRLVSIILWCFLLVALGGLGEVPWTHHTERGRFVVIVRSTQRPVVSPVTGRWEPREVSCLFGGMGRVGTESGDQARCTFWAVRRPTRVWGSSGLSERDSQGRNILGGLRHQASGREFELETPPDHYWIPGRRMTTRKTDHSFIIYSWSLPREAGTPPRTR